MESKKKKTLRRWYLTPPIYSRVNRKPSFIWCFLKNDFVLDGHNGMISRQHNSKSHMNQCHRINKKYSSIKPLYLSTWPSRSASYMMYGLQYTLKYNTYKLHCYISSTSVICTRIYSTRPVQSVFGKLGIIASYNIALSHQPTNFQVFISTTTKLKQIWIIFFL